MPCSIKEIKGLFDKYSDGVDKVFSQTKVAARYLEDKVRHKLGKFWDPLENLEFLTVPESKERMVEVQNAFYITMADINAHANRLRAAMEMLSLKDRKTLVQALDGSIDKTEVPDRIQETYERLRIAIDENAQKLVDKGMLKKENVIEDYVKRIYEAHLNETKRSGIYFNKLLARRELTYDERLAKGVIELADIVVPQTIYNQRRQLALANFFESLADKFGKDEPFENSKKIEDYSVGGGVKKYGALSGKFVPLQIHQMLQDMGVAKETLSATAQMVHLWTQVIKHIKVNVTVKNPVTHLYNVASNLQLAFMNGDYKALGEVLKMRLNDKAAFNELVAKANNHGLNSMLWDIEKSDFDIQSDHLLSIPLRILKELYMTKDSKTGKALRFAYDWEDKIFKLAAFKKHLDQGMDEKQAFKEASEVYVDYSTPLPNVWKWVDSFGFAPFLHYTYKSTPATLKVITKHPLRYGAVQFILWSFGANWLFNEDDDWAKPKWAADQWNLFFAKEWAKIADTNWYINVGRSLPGVKLGFWNFAGDMWDMPMGFIGGMMNIAQGKTPLGYKIGSQYDDAISGFIKRMGTFLENYAPPLSAGRYGQKVGGILLGTPGQNYYGQDMGLPEILLRAVGVRFFNPGAERTVKMKKANNKLKHIINDPDNSKEEKEKAWKEYNKTMKELYEKMPYEFLM